MSGRSDGFSITLLGPFRLTAPPGKPVNLSSRKGIALIAMLATSANGERTRGWLQEKLWGSREDAQAGASLRRELSNLRRIDNGRVKSLLSFDGGRVRLDLDAVDLDVVRRLGGGWMRRPGAPLDAEFLEGIDIRGEDGFEEWLKLMRSALDPRQAPFDTGEGAQTSDADMSAHRATGPRPVKTPDARAQALVHRVVDRTQEATGAAVVSEVTDQLIGLLARFSWLKIGLADSDGGSFGFDQSSGSMRYSVEGTLSGDAGAERLDFKLWRVEDRELVWSERFDLRARTQESGPPLQVAVAQIAARIEREEQTRARNALDDPTDFAQLIWLGRWRLNRLTREDSAAASRLFDAASAMAPESAEVLIQKTTTLCWEKWARRAPRSEFSVIRDLARRAILINPDDCRGYWLAGVAETWLRNPAAAIGQLTRAIEINPCFEPAHAQLGSTLNLCDRPEDALKSLDYTLMLSPYDTHVFFRYTELGVSRSILGEYERAVEWTDRALLQRPAYWYAHVVKIHALISSDDEIGAKAASREFAALHPRFSRAAIDWIPFLDRRWVDRLCSSLSRADILLV